MSQKNKEQLVHDLFIYNKKRVSRKGIEWSCIHKNCKARAFTERNSSNSDWTIKIIGMHIHNYDIDYIRKKTIANEMKGKIAQTNSTPRSVLNETLRGTDENVLSIMGSTDLIFRNLRNQRMRLVNPRPYLFPNIKISEVLSKTHTGKIFYRYGPNNYNNYPVYENIILLYSDDMMNCLKTNNVWCIDGTFSILPSPYKQLLTIGYLRNHHVFPVIFCLLGSKKFEFYNNLFEIIKLMIPNIYPTTIKVDFEQSLIQALKIHFAQSHVSGCLFHLSQALIRRLQKERLICLYKTNLNFKRFTKALLTLSFVNINEISNTFNQLKNNEAFPVELEPIYTYFYNIYISDSSIFPPELWHCRNLFESNTPRTNNAIEGWHSIFKSTFKNYRKSLPLLFMKLKDEEDVFRIKNIQMDLGFNFPRNKKYLLIENNLMIFLRNASDRNFGLIFVFGLCELLHYD